MPTGPGGRGPGNRRALEERTLRDVGQRKSLTPKFLARLLL